MKQKTATTLSYTVPQGWHAAAHQHWVLGAHQEAVREAIKHINTFGRQKPVELSLQVSYYLFLLKDYRSAVTILESQFAQTPHHLDTVLNLAVCYSRLGLFEEAVSRANITLTLAPKNIVAYDVLAKSLHQLGRFSEAVAAGTRALELKDYLSEGLALDWELPAGKPRDFAGRGRKYHVIAFSLWGDQPRYLRGALHNRLLAKEFFPGWTLRFYMDDTVPSEFIRLIESLSCEVILSPGMHTLRQRLCWRFQVANDPAVGYFLVRDADSVLSRREAQAVESWLQSDSWFHVIRDWWTHTDLMLAGMWGGVAGVLPCLSDKLKEYSPSAVETPNVDQWFLRDRVWAHVRKSCMAHDRYFRMRGSTPLPAPGDDTPDIPHVALSI